MAKISFIAVVLSCILLFNSCSPKGAGSDSVSVITQPTLAPIPTNAKAYGSYVAGRVAHLRKDFNKAADYYIKALQADPDNPELISQVYLLLASKGRISEAARYADISLKHGDNNNFTYIIIAVDKMKKGQPQEANKIITDIDGIIYKEFITPLMSSWAYAGMNEPDKALAAIDGIKKEPSFRSLYHFHAGMINDYFGRNKEARRHYETLINNENLEMSFRSLQIVTNFYIRNGEKDKALALSRKYNDEKMLADMLNKLVNNVEKANPAETKKILTDANVGMSEALFSIAATLRQGNSGLDLAHMFISLSIYANPKYDLAKLMLADILESREMYNEANQIYDEIDSSSEAYYTVQLKKANNYVLMQDYIAAEILLKTIAEENPNNYQLYLDLGDILRVRNKQDEAIKYYEQAIKKIPKLENQHWILFYALGISYEQNEDWKKAEKNFRKALELSQNHFLVLNYLGYSWLKQGRNVEQAFGMIVDAYNQAPNDGHISDSLGWAFYQLGMYDQAIKYLEKSAELEPANAIISDHLGDAYWFGRRENEAKFQWKHVLTMKDDSGEVDMKEVRRKIKHGLATNHVLSYDQNLIEEKVSKITVDNEE